MSTISNERLEEITNDKMINQGSEFAKMATELLALRKEREAAVPDGYCVMPCKLSAENGAKVALSGEFHVAHYIVCQSCGGEGCEDCNEEGGWDCEILIGWDIIKRIYEAAVGACALPHTQSTNPCPKCGNTGLADSGGVQPWGEPILIECDCTTPSAQPVAVPVAYIFKHPAGKNFWAVTDESNKEHPDVMPVYAEPPAHENVHYADAAEEEIAALRKRIAELETAPPAPVVPTFDEWLEIRGNKPLGWVKDAMRESYDACRAAMLAAPGKDEIAEQAGVDPAIADAYMQGCHDTEARMAETDTTSQQFESLASVKQPSSNLAATSKASRDSDDNSSPDSQTTIKQSDGWIPCSERMPEDGVSVLACCKCGDNFSGIYTIRAPVIRSKNSRKDDSMAHHERVTHWQPLPEPPCK